MSASLKAFLTAVEGRAGAYAAAAAGIVTAVTHDLAPVESAVLTAGGIIYAAVAHYVSRIKQAA